MENNTNTKSFNYESSAKFLVYGGIFALINTILFMILYNADMYNGTKIDFLAVFYGLHATITAVAGILLLKSKKAGLVLLYISMIFLVASLFIKPAGASIINADGYSPSEPLSIFLFTLEVSFLSLVWLLIPVPIFTIFFIVSIIVNVIRTKKWLEYLRWDITSNK